MKVESHFPFYVFFAKFMYSFLFSSTNYRKVFYIFIQCEGLPQRRSRVTLDYSLAVEEDMSLNYSL